MLRRHGDAGVGLRSAVVAASIALAWFTATSLQSASDPFDDYSTTGLTAARVVAIPGPTTLAALGAGFVLLGPRRRP